MIKKVCICDRCKKEVRDSIFEVNIYGITLNPVFGLQSADVLAHNLRDDIIGNKQLCTECKNELEAFIYETPCNEERGKDEK